MHDVLRDFALPVLLLLLASGGVGSLLISRLVPQRRSPEEKASDQQKELDALDAKLAAKDDVIAAKDRIIESQSATMRVQADYIVVLRMWGTDGSTPPLPAYPDNLKVR